MADPDSPVIGYTLYMDDGKGGAYSKIFDGSYEPGVLDFTITGLTNGLQYNFKVYALNYNGYSSASSSAAFYACSAPTGFSAPTATAQSETSISIAWT